MVKLRSDQRSVTRLYFVHRADQLHAHEYCRFITAKFENKPSSTPSPSPTSGEVSRVIKRMDREEKRELSTPLPLHRGIDCWIRWGCRAYHVRLHIRRKLCLNYYNFMFQRCRSWSLLNSLDSPGNKSCSSPSELVPHSVCARTEKVVHKKKKKKQTKIRVGHPAKMWGLLYAFSRIYGVLFGYRDDVCVWVNNTLRIKRLVS